MKEMEIGFLFYNIIFSIQFHYRYFGNLNEVVTKKKKEKRKSECINDYFFKREFKKVILNGRFYQKLW